MVAELGVQFLYWQAKEEEVRKVREAAEQKRREEEEARRRERERAVPSPRPAPDQGFYEQSPRGMPNGPMARGAPPRSDFRAPQPQGGRRDFSGSWRREGDVVGPKQLGRGRQEETGPLYGARPRIEDGIPLGRGQGRGVEERRPRGGARGGMSLGPGRGGSPGDREWSWRAPESGARGAPAQEGKEAEARGEITAPEAKKPSEAVPPESKPSAKEEEWVEAPPVASSGKADEPPASNKQAPAAPAEPVQQEQGSQAAVLFTHPQKVDTKTLPPLNFMAPQMSPGFLAPPLQFGLPQTPRTLNTASQQVSLAPEVLQALSKYSNHSDSQKLIEQVTQRQPKEQAAAPERQVSIPKRQAPLPDRQVSAPKKEEPVPEKPVQPPQETAPPPPPPQNAWVARQAAALAAASKEAPLPESKPSRAPAREVVNAMSGQPPPRVSRNWQQTKENVPAEGGGDSTAGAGLLGPGDAAWGQRSAAATSGRGRGGAQAPGRGAPVGNRGRGRGPAPGRGRGGAAGE
jgi:hypothetical protein